MEKIILKIRLLMDFGKFPKNLRIKKTIVFRKILRIMIQILASITMLEQKREDRNKD